MPQVTKMVEETAEKTTNMRHVTKNFITQSLAQDEIKYYRGKGYGVCSPRKPSTL
jgi:hypothetical protein